MRMHRKGTGLVCRCCGHLVSRTDLQRSDELPMPRTAAAGARTQKGKAKKKGPKSGKARKSSEGPGAVCTQCNGEHTKQDEARLVAADKAGHATAETRVSRVRAHAAKAGERPVTGEHFHRAPGTGHKERDEMLRQVACFRPSVLGAYAQQSATHLKIFFAPPHTRSSTPRKTRKMTATC